MYTIGLIYNIWFLAQRIWLTNGNVFWFSAWVDTL